MVLFARCFGMATLNSRGCRHDAIVNIRHEAQLAVPRVVVEQKITDPNLLISLIFLIFQNAVLRLVSVFDH